jgi:hypothetical protein
MPSASDVLRTHPHQPSTMGLIIACVEACTECARACSACADACLGQVEIADLRECIRLNLDCADVCAATGAVVSRLTRPHRTPMKALLLACIEICRTCGEVCVGHANTHGHSRVCAEVCRNCERACVALVNAIP